MIISPFQGLRENLIVPQGYVALHPGLLHAVPLGLGSETLFLKSRSLHKKRAYLNEEEKQ